MLSSIEKNYSILPPPPRIIRIEDSKRLVENPLVQEAGTNIRGKGPGLSNLPVYRKKKPKNHHNLTQTINISVFFFNFKWETWAQREKKIILTPSQKSYNSKIPPFKNPHDTTCEVVTAIVMGKNLN